MNSVSLSNPGYYQTITSILHNIIVMCKVTSKSSKIECIVLTRHQR